MACGKFRWRYPANRSVGTDLIVIVQPRGEDLSGLRQRIKHMLVQAFVAESGIEAFDVTILHRSARLDQDVAALRPAHEGPAGALLPPSINRPKFEADLLIKISKVFYLLNS